MSIISFEFVGALALLALLYYVLPMKCRAWLLLAASAAFWVLYSVQGTMYLLFETAVIWGGALVIKNRRAQGKTGKLWLALILVFSFAAMMFIKEHVRLEGLLGFGENTLWPFTAMIGISYFTFQSAGYLIDVYRGKADAEKNYLKVLFFVGYFPQLGQGPISLWKDLQPQLTASHRLDPQGVVEAVFLMAWGFFKKLVIADRIAVFVNAMFTHDTALPGWLMLFVVLAYTAQLYTDFSGGIDIVRGASLLFGIRLTENFRQPFFARSVGEYWRRWHISLGTWFRTYLLYPLATSRAGVKVGQIGQKLLGAKAGRGLPGALAALIVFICIGLWHAIHLNALLYGVWFGLLSMAAILLEPLFKKWKKSLHITKKTRWFSVWGLVRTWLAVLTAQFFACTATPQQAFSMMKRVVTDFDFSTFGQMQSLKFYQFDSSEWIVAGVALVILFVVDLLCEHRKDFLKKVASSPVLLRWTLLMLLMLSVLIFGHYGAGIDASQFVYAGF